MHIVPIYVDNYKLKFFSLKRVKLKRINLYIFLHIVIEHIYRGNKLKTLISINSET